MNLLKTIFGSKHQRDIKRMMPIINKINSLEKGIKNLSDQQLKDNTPKFREMLKKGSNFDEILPEAFATVREASIRVLSLRPFDVQLMGGIILLRGNIAEMKTGEGKTLCATLPLYMHGLTSKGAHLVTVNDYLAQRDANDMGQLFNWLGLTVGCIISDMEDQDRKKAYAADITYGTNNEFAFDYLRDNMKFSLDEYVQRDHNYCIVDEVDSILIDEARTPLLISGPSEENSNIYQRANLVVPKLTANKHFTVDEKSRSIMMNDEGILEIQKTLNIENIYKLEHSELLHSLNQALKAHYLFKIDVDYVIRDGQIIIVDEFTGRLKHGSRWSDGLHQAIEAKENVEIKSENQTLASITFQNYFKLYKSLAGMTGTADTEAEEFRKIYNLDVTVIPTNVPVVRVDEPDVIYKTKEAKIKAACDLIKSLHKKGQPVLVGTNSIDSSEIFSTSLKKYGIKHEVLNAKHHQREANIIANAGQEHAVTIATNMAGRGTDIKLTDKTKSLDGLFIVGTERNEARRIDNQLRGRSGRQGDSGRSKFFLSLEDDLMRIFGSERIKHFMTTLGMKDDEPIEHKMITNAIAKSQKKVEAHNFEIRKHLLEYDNVMNEHRKVIYSIRKDILSDKDNLEFLYEIIDDVAEFIVETHRPDKKIPINSWPWEEINHSFKNIFHTEDIINHGECAKNYDDNIATYIATKAKDMINSEFNTYPKEQVKAALREILLSTFDQHWKDHLLAMDHVKEGINLKAYAQKDPLTEYKREAFNLFEAMRISVKKSIVKNIFSVRLYTEEEIKQLQEQHLEQMQQQLEMAKIAKKQTNIPKKRTNKKVGRNQPCPCGSGKKYKHCCYV